MCIQKQQLWGKADGQMFYELLCLNICTCNICTPDVPCTAVSVVKLKNFFSV